MSSDAVTLVFGSRPRSIDPDDWANNWLGMIVEFTLCGTKLRGEVVETERFLTPNGWHDIVTVEIDGDPKQVKVQLHRQACRRLRWAPWMQRVVDGGRLRNGLSEIEPATLWCGGGG